MYILYLFNLINTNLTNILYFQNDNNSDTSHISLWDTSDSGEGNKECKWWKVGTQK